MYVCMYVCMCTYWLLGFESLSKSVNYDGELYRLGDAKEEQGKRTNLNIARVPTLGKQQMRIQLISGDRLLAQYEL